MREIQRIFIHCTAGSQKQTKKDLLNEFKAKGWKAPGYHYVVFPDGKIEQLLDESKVSNGVQGYNSTSINVAYVGGIDNKGRATDNRTNQQKESLSHLLKDLKKRYPNAHIMGHRDIWGKSPSKWKKMCPCFDAEKEYAYLDNVELEKYSDSTYTPLVSGSPFKRESWLDKIKKLAPWHKTH
jgi:N-acetylmuramoyl-L-alanine amidase